MRAGRSRRRIGISPECLADLDHSSGVKLGKTYWTLPPEGDDTADRGTRRLLLLLRDDVELSGLWPKLRTLCESDATFQIQAEGLLAAAMESFHAAVRDPRVPKKKLVAQASKIAKDARRLLRAMDAHREFRFVLCGEYWTAKELERAESRVERAGSLIRWSGPKVVQLLDRLIADAERNSRQIGEGVAPKVGRADFKETAFLKAMCAQLRGQFPAAPIADLAAIANCLSRAAAGNPMDADYVNRAKAWLSSPPRARKVSGKKPGT